MDVSIDRFNRAHLWLGNISLDEEDYEEYFQPNEEGMSQFSIDLGLLYEYDEDFIGIIPISHTLLPIDELCKESIISISEMQNIMNNCAFLGIEKANAIVWYSDSDISFTIGKKLSNNLIYIGEFDTEMA